MKGIVIPRSLAMCKMLALVLWESAISPVPGAGDIPVHLLC